MTNFAGIRFFKSDSVQLMLNLFRNPNLDHSCIQHVQQTVIVYQNCSEQSRLLASWSVNFFIFKMTGREWLRNRKMIITFLFIIQTLFDKAYMYVHFALCVMCCSVKTHLQINKILYNYKKELKWIPKTNEMAYLQSY